MELQSRDEFEVLIMACGIEYRDITKLMNF